MAEELTPQQKRYIRLMSGDMETTPEIDDDDLQMLHDIEPEDGCGCTNPLDTTVVWVLRARVALAQKLVNETNEQAINVQLNQKRKALEVDLERWEKKCNMAPVGRVTISRLNLGLSSRGAGDEFSPYPPWFYTWIGGL